MYDIRQLHGKPYLTFTREDKGMRNVRVYEEARCPYPFVIARGSRSEAKVVVVELEEDGVKGVGECTPYPRYGESIASVMARDGDRRATGGGAYPRTAAAAAAGRRRPQCH